MVAFARNQYSGGAIVTYVPLGMGASDASFTLNASTGWPTGGANGNFRVVVDFGLPTQEKILCSAQSGGVVTVAASGRGYDGTSAVLHGANCSVQVVHIAQDDDEANQLVANLGNVAKGAILLGGGAATLPSSLAALAEGALLMGKGTGNNPVALTVGASGTVPQSNGTDPVWQYPVLTTLSGGNGGNVTLTTNTQVPVYTSPPSLAVGKWLVTMNVLLQTPASTGGNCEFWAAVGTATATFGPATTPAMAFGNNNQGMYGSEVTLSMTFFATVTVTGTVQLTAYNTAGGSNAIALSNTLTEGQGPATFWTATRVA